MAEHPDILQPLKKDLDKLKALAKKNNSGSNWLDNICVISQTLIDVASTIIVTEGFRNAAGSLQQFREDFINATDFQVFQQCWTQITTKYEFLGFKWETVTNICQNGELPCPEHRAKLIDEVLAKPWGALKSAIDKFAVFKLLGVLSTCVQIGKMLEQAKAVHKKAIAGEEELADHQEEFSRILSQIPKPNLLAQATEQELVSLTGQINLLLIDLKLLVGRLELLMTATKRAIEEAEASQTSAAVGGLGMAVQVATSVVGGFQLIGIASKFAYSAMVLSGLVNAAGVYSSITVYNGYKKDIEKFEATYKAAKVLINKCNKSSLELLSLQSSGVPK